MANVRQVVSENADIINFLLQNRFETLTYEDQIFIAGLDRPCPAMTSLINQNSNSANRKFCVTWFKKFLWLSARLSGSETKNKLYCWPCLLFSQNSKTPWNSTGIDNLKTLYKTTEKHNISKDHTHSSLKYKLFGRLNIQTSLDSAHRISIIKHNETVKENRDILQRLVDMTIFLITQELGFRGHNEKVDSQNKGNFRELAEFLSVYDSKFNAFLQETSVFSGLSKTIQNDLIHSINHVVSQFIVRNSKFCLFFMASR